MRQGFKSQIVKKKYIYIIRFEICVKSNYIRWTELNKTKYARQI
jgi:hypothetical protein